jgi:outer membrane protein/protease secretion system outer membrane protein
VTTVNTRYTNRSVGLQLSVAIFSGGFTSSVVRQAVAE